jgi:hypothetical protein
VFVRFLSIALLCGSVYAAEVAGVSAADSTSAGLLPVKEPSPDIPLPKQSAYTGKGFTVGIGAGAFDPSEECDGMGVWQGQVDYFYTPWLSGGAEVRFFGGDMDSENSLLYSRYRVFGKFHFAFQSLSFYLSPMVGLETTDISEIRKDLKGRDDDDADEDVDTLSEKSNCEKMFSLDGFTVGIEGGAGWAFSKYVGAFVAVQYEYSFSKAQLLTVTPGLGLNLRSIWGWAQKNTNSLWITLEGGGQRYFNRDVTEWANYLILGFVLGV